MFCVSAVNTLHNEKLVAVPAQQAVTKSDSFPLIQTRGEGLPPENPKQLLTRLEISFELGMRQTNRRTGEANERSNIFGRC
jgi:hypothetical protein